MNAYFEWKAMADPGGPSQPTGPGESAEGTDPPELRAALRRWEEERSLREAAERYSDALSTKALELAQAEESLRRQVEIVEEQRRFLEQVFAASTAGLALADEELRYVMVNPAYRALTPWPDQDPVGRRFEEVWGRVGPPLDLGSVLASGAPLHVEGYEAVFPDGGRHLFSFHVKRVQHGGRPALLGAVWETTDMVLARRAAEAAAADAQRLASERDTVLAAIPHGVVVYDEVGRIVRANAAAQAIAGFTPEDRAAPALERIPRMRFLGDDGNPLAPEHTPPIRALRGETVSGEVLARAPAEPGGHVSWLAISAAPMCDAEGRRVGAVAAFLDVTRERELVEMREDLLRTISHDLRTPLQAVLTHAHLLRRAPDLPPRAAERAEAIVRTAERMTGMLQELVEMVLLESGHLTLTRVRLELPAFVRELLDRLSSAMPPERVTLAIEPRVPAIHADPVRLERVVVNLLSNALKYSPPETAVELRVGAAPSGCARLEVIDHGVGIAPEDVPRIFGRFFRVGGARRPEGLGLGLYIARRVVQAHGGTIDVETAPGCGSRFVVDLPAAAPDPRAARRTRREAP